MAHQAQIHQLFHLAPGLHEVLVDVGLGVGTARAHVAAGRMEIGKRPVDQVHVQVIEPQVGERLAARGDHIDFGVLVVPQLGGDPEFLALDAAGAWIVAERCADLGLRCRRPRRNRNAGSPPRGALDRFGDLIGGNVVGSECAQADGGHQGAGVKLSLGDDCRIDPIGRGKHNLFVAC